MTDRTDISLRAACGERARTAEALRVFDNHDPRLPYYHLALERSLEELDDYPLPEGHRFVNYRPGDREAWIGIEMSAREFHDFPEGEDAWRRYYEGYDAELVRRMFFIEDAAGQKVATATAFYDIETGDNGTDGWVHWVAVRREHQGRGLSKPLVARVMRELKALGYRRAVVPTQTTTWLACKVYLDMGFRPVPENAVSGRKGWEIVKALTDHPALAGFGTADVGCYLAGGGSCGQDRV